jgi:hypothetical protein
MSKLRSFSVGVLCAASLSLAGALAGPAVANASVAATANAQPDCSPSARADSILNMAAFVESHPEVRKMLGAAWRQSTPQERRAAIEAYLARHPDEGGACGR